MDEPGRRQLRGGCHCGAIRVALEWPGPGPAIPVRACGCGFCVRHGAVWTSHPEGRFSLRIAEGCRATPYRLGTRTADFHVCPTCGVVPIATCVIGGSRYAVVNAHALDDAKSLFFMRTDTDFEGETTDGRLARRQRNWTPEAAGDVG